MQTRVKWPYFEVYGHYTSQNLLTLAYLTFFRCVLKFLMCDQLTKNLAKNLARNLARKWQKTSGEKNDQKNGRGKCVKNANTRFKKNLKMSRVVGLSYNTPAFSKRGSRT